MTRKRQIPKLPGGAINYVRVESERASKRAKGGMRPVDPRTMDPKLRRFLKQIGVL